MQKIFDAWYKLGIGCAVQGAWHIWRDLGCPARVAFLRGGESGLGTSAEGGEKRFCPEKVSEGHLGPASDDDESKKRGGVAAEVSTPGRAREAPSGLTIPQR